MRRIDDPCSAGQRRDSRHLVVSERDVEDLQIFTQLFDILGARDGNDTILLHEPPQRDLRDAQLPSPGDLLHHGVAAGKGLEGVAPYSTTHPRASAIQTLE